MLDIEVETYQTSEQNSASSDAPEIENDEIVLPITQIETAPYNVNPIKIALSLLKDAGLMIGSFTFSYSLIAMSIMIGRLAGKDDVNQHLGATALISSTIQTETMMIGSTLYALSIVAAKRLGKLRRLTQQTADEALVTKQRELIRDVFRSGLCWSITTLPPMMLTMYYSEAILRDWFGQDKATTALVGKYLRIYTFALPAYMLRMTTEQLLFAYRKQFPAMLMGLTNFFIATGVSIWLGFGSPNLGIQGIAIGYLIDAYLTAFGFSTFIALQKEFRKLKLFSPFGWGKALLKTLKEILSIGLPIDLQLTCELVVAQLLVAFAGQLGSEALAAQSFSNQLIFITVIPIIAFGQSIAHEFSRALGHNYFAYASRVTKVGLLLSTGAITSIASIFAIKPELLGKLMTHQSISPRVINLAQKVVPITAATVVCDTNRYGTLQVLRAANKKYVPTFISIAILGFGLLMAFILGMKMGLHLIGIEVGSLLGVGLAALILLSQWAYTTRKSYLSNLNETTINPININRISSWYQNCKACFFRNSSVSLETENSLSEIPEAMNESTPVMAGTTI